MNITSIRIVRPKDRTSSVLAYVDIEISGSVTLRAIRMVKNKQDEYLLRMSGHKSKNGTYRDMFNPISTPARDEMTAAVVRVFEQAVEQDVNELKVQVAEVTAPPAFTNIHIHRFPQNRHLKAFASCLLNGEIALNRLAIVLDNETQMLRLSMPSFEIARTGGFASYYRLNAESYKALYDAVISAYAISSMELD